MDEVLQKSQHQCQITIDIEFENESDMLEVFKVARLDQFTPQTIGIKEEDYLDRSFERIENPDEIYIKYFKRYVDELERIINNEFGTMDCSTSPVYF